MSPGPRYFAGYTFDPDIGGVLVYAGADNVGPVTDLWSWNGTGWLSVAAAYNPGARSSMMMAHDSARTETILFGGRGLNGQLSNTLKLSVVRTVGSDCTTGSQCGTGLCVDGVCCSSECGFGVVDCQRCDFAGLEGTCTPAASTVVCRVSAGVCDQAETCNGTSGKCPVNSFGSMGTTCSNGVFCDGAEVCDGLGTCQSGTPEPSCADAGAGPVADAGMASDAGLTDAGAPLTDAGTTDAGVPTRHELTVGCSCQSSGGAEVLVGLALALALARRRQARP